MYDKLVPELRDDPSGVGYAAMSDEQVAQKMLEPAGVEVVSYFAGFRTLAAILAQAEYDYLRSMLDVMATQSRMVADMVRMLEMPGDERGVGGGVDFGHPAVRQFVQRWHVRRADQRADGSGRHEHAWSVQDRAHGY